MTDNKIPFEKSFASHEKAKYWSDKNELKPENIRLQTHNKYLFNCDKCNHEFEKQISEISLNNGWCSFCANRKLCINNNCNICFEKSFDSHEKSDYWSNKNKVRPRNIFKNTHDTFIFNCKICNHEFQTSPKIINMGCWCNYCANKELCNSNNCNICFEKSFASHEKSEYWSNKNNIKPRNIFKNSNSKQWFDCKKCNHIFEINLNNIASNDRWCPYCANKKLCESEVCIACFEKSFASNEKVKYWKITNNINPRNLFKRTDKKFDFICNLCNLTYTASLSNVTAGYWCNCVKNKTEQKLYNEIVKVYSNLIKQYKIEWCKNITYLPFDFCILEHKIIIELDGQQHFKQVSNWSSPEEQFKNDKYKEKCANNNGYSIVRILQEDVFNDKYDWKPELINNIEKIKKNNINQNIYMCKNN